MKITGNPKLVVRSLRLSGHLAQTIDQAATRLRLDQATATRLAIEIGLADLESIDYDLAGAILRHRHFRPCRSSPLTGGRRRLPSFARLAIGDLLFRRMESRRRVGPNAGPNSGQKPLFWPNLGQSSTR